MNWSFVQLGNVVAAESGFGFPRELQGDQDGDIPFYKVGDMNHPANQRDMVNANNYVTRTTLTQLKAKTFPAGTVVFPKIGAAIATGKKRILSREATYDNNVMGLVPGECVLPMFLYYWTLQFDFTTISNIGPVPSIRKSEIEKLPFPLPPMSEQRRIVQTLDQAYALRQQRCEADDKAHRILPALFRSLFGDPATNAKQWPTMPLGSVLLETQYGTSAKSNLNSAGPVVLRMNNIRTDGELDLEDLKHVDLPPEEVAKYTLCRGDILFNRTNSRELVGKTGLWREETDKAVAASYLIRLRVNEQLTRPEYVWAYLNTPYVKSLLFDVARRAVGMANINAQELRSLPFILPDLDSQDAFVRMLNSYRLIRIEQAKVGKIIGRLFNSLLYRAFNQSLTAVWREQNAEQVHSDVQEQLTALEKATKRKRNRKAVDKSEDGTSADGRHVGHDSYNKAALLAYIVGRCYSEQYPYAMTRVRVAKLFYLAQRRGDVSLTQQFDRQAAGPLDRDWFKVVSLAVRKQDWLKEVQSTSKTKPLAPGSKIAGAIEHVRNRFADATATIDAMLETMKKWSADALERWATVDEAAVELRRQGKLVTGAAVKDFIASQAKWKAKLERQAFSDFNIEATLRGLRDQGFLPS